MASGWQSALFEDEDFPNFGEGSDDWPSWEQPQSLMNVPSIVPSDLDHLNATFGADNSITPLLRGDRRLSATDASLFDHAPTSQVQNLPSGNLHGDVNLGPLDLRTPNQNGIRPATEDSQTLASAYSPPPALRASSDIEADMLPTRRRGPHARANDVVDLTAISPSPDDDDAQSSHGRKRTAGHLDDSGSSKRRKRAAASDTTNQIDLVEEDPTVEEKLLRTQQADALKTQEENKEDGPMKIGRMSCIICMESYTNTTVSHCGHVFCHECLIRALIASEKNSDRRVGVCPSCRKPISRKKGHQVIPINFMKRGSYNYRRDKEQDASQ